MATATRNQIMIAILNVIQNMTFSAPVCGSLKWNTVTNRLRLWGDVPADQQPYAALVTHREIDVYRGLGLLRRTLDLGIWCYVRTDANPGAPYLDTIMEAAEAAFNPADNFSTNNNTLGGLVYSVQIAGRIFKDPGDIDNQAMMIIPISVEIP